MICDGSFGQPELDLDAMPLQQILEVVVAETLEIIPSVHRAKEKKMKFFVPIETIVVALAGITFLIAACSGEATPEDVANTFCSWEASCAEEWDEEPLSQEEIDECIEYEERAAEDLQDKYGQECLNAWEDLVSCLSNVDCEEYLDEPQCEDLQEEYEQVCS